MRFSQQIMGKEWTFGGWCVFHRVMFVAIWHLLRKKKQSFYSPINKHFMTWLDIIIKVDEKSFAKSVVK